MKLHSFLASGCWICLSASMSLQATQLIVCPQQDEKKTARLLKELSNMSSNAQIFQDGQITPRGQQLLPQRLQELINLLQQWEPCSLLTSFLSYVQSVQPNPTVQGVQKIVNDLQKILNQETLPLSVQQQESPIPTTTIATTNTPGNGPKHVIQPKQTLETIMIFKKIIESNIQILIKEADDYTQYIDKQYLKNERLLFAIQTFVDLPKGMTMAQEFVRQLLVNYKKIYEKSNQKKDQKDVTNALFPFSFLFSSPNQSMKKPLTNDFFRKLLNVNVALNDCINFRLVPIIEKNRQKFFKQIIEATVSDQKQPLQILQELLPQNEVSLIPFSNIQSSLTNLYNLRKTILTLTKGAEAYQNILNIPDTFIITCGTLYNYLTLLDESNGTLHIIPSIEVLRLWSAGIQAIVEIAQTGQFPETNILKYGSYEKIYHIFMNFLAQLFMTLEGQRALLNSINMPAPEISIPTLQILEKSPYQKVIEILSEAKNKCDQTLKTLNQTLLYDMGSTMVERKVDLPLSRLEATAHTLLVSLNSIEMPNEKIQQNPPLSPKFISFILDNMANESEVQDNLWFFYLTEQEKLFEENKSNCLKLFSHLEEKYAPFQNKQITEENYREEILKTIEYTAIYCEVLKQIVQSVDPQWLQKNKCITTE